MVETTQQCVGGYAGFWWMLCSDAVGAIKRCSVGYKRCGGGYTVMWWRLYSDVSEAILDVLEAM